MELLCVMRMLPVWHTHQANSLSQQPVVPTLKSGVLLTLIQSVVAEFQSSGSLVSRTWSLYCQTWHAFALFFILWRPFLLNETILHQVAAKVTFISLYDADQLSASNNFASVICSSANGDSFSQLQLFQ